MKRYTASLKECNYNSCFPFSAVAGQEKIKKALILNVVNPNIGGVLISGEKGTAKSTLVRGLADIMEDMQVINLPLNITEDRLVGSIDIKEAIKTGKKRLEEGILKKAHRQFLYIDEINLLSEHIVNILLEVSSTGVNVIEREGISYSHSSKFVLAGSMNPEEGLLRSQLLDRFGLYVEASGVKDIDTRIEIIERRLIYEKDSRSFCKQWENENKKLKNRIQKAKENIKKIKLSKENYKLCAQLSQEGKCAGHRAEIVIIETAKAIAAFNGKNMVEYEDIKEAAAYALPHRIREKVSLKEDEDENAKNSSEENENIEACSEENRNTDSDENEDIRGDERKGTEEEDNKSTESNVEEEDNNNPIEGNVSQRESSNNNDISNSNQKEEASQHLEEIEPVKDELCIDVVFQNRNEAQGSGKRSKVRTDSYQGRYVKYRFPKGKAEDIAIDATLRIAAGNQKSRASGELALSIRHEDIRVKVREKHIGASILFAVDASGSMGAKRRMGAVKGAVLSLLNDAYQKRDKVGIIAFRKDNAELLLDITRSVDLAEKCLKDLPTGGKTPLALGLYKAYELLKVEKIKNPDSLQYLIVVSDGKANIPLNSDNAFEDSLKIAEKIHNEGIKSMVIDTENGYIQYDFAKQLSEKMESKYVKINNVSKNKIESNVKKLIKAH